MKSERARVVVRGAVQGVGFRPFIFRLAKTLQLNGWVLNSAEGVVVEAEGSHETLCEFLRAIETEKPAAALIERIEHALLDVVGYENFKIRESDSSAEKTALISPDLATCDDCLREIFDPQNRRYNYPFTNCTNCGPRFSIIEALPYDRANTSMKHFAMCAECKREYHDPENRRFHAQPDACPNCGPQLELWNEHGKLLSRCNEALHEAAQKIRAGEIIALKGLGGFQLLVDARNENAVGRLRERKRREEKPFALMFPDLDFVRAECHISELEQKLLCSAAAPIVLLAHRGSPLTSHAAPGNPNLGAMLPYTPLHHLLLRELGFPIVATSGNASDEPICIDEFEALHRLREIADFFLVHNRPIVRHVDDSIVRVVCGRELMLRRARGFAPLPIHVKERLPKILAVGAHLKNSVALSAGKNIFISQHIGDLQTKQAWLAFRKSAADLPQLYNVAPELIAHDLHPDYLSSQFAVKKSLPRIAVQHHWAHVLSCIAENGIEPPVLGVAWDGTGFGTDGTIWGGEFFLVEKMKRFRRVISLRPFRLPGGETAIKEPWRAALGLLHEIGIASRCPSSLLREIPKSDLAILEKALANKINSPLTSSAGRLFDAVASLLNLKQRASFEGQSAMELEFAIQPGVKETYSFEIAEKSNTEHRTSNAEVSEIGAPCSPEILNWESMIRGILDDLSRGESVGVIAAKFHNTLCEMIVSVAEKFGEPRVVLSGGCFQNKYLMERTVRRLREEGFSPCWHHWIPPNDGGIALGQILAAAWEREFNAKTSGDKDAES